MVGRLVPRRSAVSGSAHLDTHVVVALYAGRVDGLSARARAEIEARDLRVSPMVRLELAFLREIGRITPEPSEILDDLALRIGLRVCDAPFARVASMAVSLPWTRDPFDRVIVAQALLTDAMLVTRDRRILAECPAALG